MTGTVSRLSKGLNTIIGEDGIGLSVGERQRVQIARILASKPKILVLDEATANLDYATEHEIRKSLLDLKGQCTILTIAHRPAMVRDADHVIVIDSGKVRASGSIKDTIEKNIWFKNMMDSKSGNEAHV